MAEDDSVVDASGLFEEAEKNLAPPPWIDFNHPDFPEYFQILALDDEGKVKAWWQRVPEHLRDNSKFP
ncbi:MULTISPECIES: hypothetical protein [unclassified Nostoc]|uniref:hypothetical protein n=1 Tax=unclassified Nostoc TaxID=2593658 RepID=UPI000B953041|nr:hypothetical protein [Nostoc sp. 'Peltigera membranacea cyanobiont' 232]OYE05633.1 hypothetical protein CDG79_06725 [Nostoc sp. 'Peltigera membranacea cyanobiont' 232]